MPRSYSAPSAQDLAHLTDWTLTADGRAIERSIDFQDFSAAFAFMTRVAMRAEQLDHHPEWTNVWRRVDIRLTTHDAQGLTSLDLQLARFIDSLVS